MLIAEWLLIWVIYLIAYKLWYNASKLRYEEDIEAEYHRGRSDGEDDTIDILRENILDTIDDFSQQHYELSAHITEYDID